ncbi:DUF397 domain-containing protein [Actinomadura sp. NEAU-AAG5]|uniref:DUF397 domain-containing protein n=2 Tax=Actinomadura litoris TaxID=2678616 RepID=A0A7K1KVF1_9ACTN|nr:DUF397 domain-containing protein [Actinomadura litoris]
MNDDACVELARLDGPTTSSDSKDEWRKTSRSGGVTDNACVETVRLDGFIGVRDSKDPEGPRLAFGAGEFGGLVARIRRGELDLG